MKKEKIVNVILDCDDTVRNYTLADEKIIKMVQNYLNITNKFGLLIVKFMEFLAWTLRSFGIIKASNNSLELRLTVHALLLRVEPQSYINAYYEFAKNTNYAFEGVEKMIQTLNDKGYNIYIASNNKNSFDFCVSIGVKKENIYITRKNNSKKETIENIIKKNHLEKSQTIMVGDSLIEDVFNAIKLNVKSVWINYEGRLRKEFTLFWKPNYIIKDITQLSEII